MPAATSAAARRMMRAVKLSGHGGLEALNLTSTTRPVLETGQVLVRIAATSVNRGDIMQRKGHYPPPAGVTDTLGLEFAGTIVDVEDSLEESPGHVPEVGSRVMGIVPGGGYAEFVAVPATSCIPIPQSMSFTEAAAIPETYLTAFQTMHHHAGILPDPAASAQYLQGLRPRPPSDAIGRKHRMLVHAGASGVGIAACQIASLFDIVSITTSSEAKVDACRQWAAYSFSRTPNAESGDVFADKVEGAVGKNGVDMVLDPVFGGKYTTENARVLALDGSIVCISFLGGAKLPELNASTLFAKRATLRFSSLRGQSDFYKSHLISQFRRRVMSSIAAGKIKPVIAKTFPLEDVKEAHRVVEANEIVGKCVLVVDKHAN